jgi:hypothetical protein
MSATIENVVNTVAGAVDPALGCGKLVPHPERHPTSPMAMLILIRLICRCIDRSDYPFHISFILAHLHQKMGVPPQGNSNLEKSNFVN